MDDDSLGNLRALIKRSFKPYELLSIAFLVFLDVLIILFHSNAERWLFHVLEHIALIGIITAIAVAENRYRSKGLTFVRCIYPFFLLFFLFEEMERFTLLVFPGWKNHILIAADRFLFGVDPTVWLEKIQSLPLTEGLEIIYFSYYFLLPVGGLLLYFVARREAFEGLLTSVALAFSICFVGYILLPAEGPWKTLAHLQTVDLRMSFFHRLVATIQGHGGIIGGCFPSAHVSNVFAALTASYFYLRKLFYFLLPYSVLLAFSTVYGRYHYAVDAIAGVGIGLVSGIVAKRMERRGDEKDSEGIRRRKKG